MDINAKREYKYDTMRFILIVLVVLGHFLELFIDSNLEIIYKIIYSFHVSGLIFLVGKYAKFNRRKILIRFVVPYFIFQTVYLLFEKIILNNSNVDFTYTTPYWLLWFMFAIIVYNILIPLLPEKNSNAIYLILVSLLISLISGFDNSIGYYFSLGRIITFFPFFLIGYYCEVLDEICTKFNSLNKYHKFIKEDVIAIIGIVIGEWYICTQNVPISLLYGANGYSYHGGIMADKIIFYVTACSWIVVLTKYIPNKRITIVSTLGSNTMPVYLLHGFVIKLVMKYSVFSHFTESKLIIVIVISIFLVIVFGRIQYRKLFTLMCIYIHKCIRLLSEIKITK